MNLSRPTWLEIDLSAIENNIQQIRQQITQNCLLMAIVKANGYGHGAIPVAKAALKAGADRLGVATLGEGLELRNAGIDAPLLVLGYTPAWLAQDAIANNITTTIYDLETAHAFGQTAERAATVATIHIKVNTGMNRLGLEPDAVLGFITELEASPHLYMEGIYTHFATADEADKAFALGQYTRFVNVIEALKAAGLCPPISHAANSAATLTLPEAHCQMVRCGIALYGLHPDAVDTPLPETFQPALCWKAQVAHLIKLNPGDGVSYGRSFVAERPMTVAVIPVGYADGFPRSPQNWGQVLIHGQMAPILGRVCMDQTVVDITELVAQGEFVAQGDEVVLIGKQGDRTLSAEEIGRQVGTINYEVVSRILPRVPRLYSPHTECETSR